MHLCVVTRNKSIAATTLHALMNINMHAMHRKIHVDVHFVTDLSSLSKILKTGERIIWFDYASNINESLVPQMLDPFEKDIKALVKKGRAEIEKDMEAALETATNIGASVIDGAACCGKFVKDDLESPTLFDEWLIECERMSDAMTSLKNFDEGVGDED